MTRREVLGTGLAFSAWTVGAQGTPVPKPPLGAFGREAAASLMPPSVFFAGQVASVQGRNTGGARMARGLLVAGVVDTAGYSSGVQERYQAYLLLDTPVRFVTHTLTPGAYGCGVVSGQFLVMDLSAKVLWTVSAPRDAALARPTPLQIVADAKTGAFRLYLGRAYAVFTPDEAGAGL